MYNPDTKGRFLWSMECKIGRQYRLRCTYNQIFGKTESIEKKYGRDFAELSVSELGSFDELFKGTTTLTPLRIKSGLLQYFEWYRVTFPQKNVSGAMSWIMSVLESYKEGIVASPTHLQIMLDKIFDPEDSPTMHTIYRSYLWVAFSGVMPPQVAITGLTADNIDFSNLKFTIDNQDYPIYQQAIKSLTVTAYATELLYKHPNYTNPIMRDRVENGSIFRGVKSDTDVHKLYRVISQICSDRKKESADVKMLTYSSVLHSGIFYRQYELEAAGMDVDFSHLAKRVNHYGREITRAQYVSRTNELNWRLQDEYYIWKYLLFKDKI